MVNSSLLDFILMARLGKNEEILSGKPWSPFCFPHLQVQGLVFFSLTSPVWKFEVNHFWTIDCTWAHFWASLKSPYTELNNSWNVTVKQESEGELKGSHQPKSSIQ